MSSVGYYQSMLQKVDKDLFEIDKNTDFSEDEKQKMIKSILLTKQLLLQKYNKLLFQMKEGNKNAKYKGR